MSQSFTPNPFWWEAAPREAPEAHSAPENVDVAIIGAGYAGLSAARTLAKAGRDVVVFEAGAPGQGASSRSGGMVGHGHRLSYANLQARFGRLKAIALIKEGLASLEFAADLISAEKIEAKWSRSGRFRGAATPADYEAMGPEVDALSRDLGMQVELVPKSAVHREIVTDVYHGGIIFHQHGGLHPALFHKGLLALARNAGARVCAFTPVTRVSGTSGQFMVHHAGGTTRARDVIICTNGHSGAAVPDIAKRIIGMPSYLIATEPLGEARVRALIPNGRMIVETGSTHLYYRPSPDGERIILGGRAALHPIPLEVSARRLSGFLAEVFPDLGPVGVSHAWTGNVAMTRSDLPGIGRHDGVWHAAGCNGSGVALMPYLGHKVALQLLGNPEGRTEYDGIEMPALPFYDGRPWFLPLMTAWYRFKDWRAGRPLVR